MDYSKHGKDGTTMQQLAADQELLKALGTGGGASVEQIARNGVARERKVARKVMTPQTLKEYCKPIAVDTSSLY